MADLVYNSFKAELMRGNIDLAAGNFKLMLVTSTYVPDVDAHADRADVTNEVVGTGYTAGGAALAGKSVTQDNANDEADFDANDVVWSNATITARAAILYLDTGVAANDTLIAYFDFGSDQSSSNGDFTAQFNLNGILSLS